MASCTQVDSLVQAYVDGELRDSERAILEKHLSDCAACREMLGQQREAAAMMFEALAPHQLNHDLVDGVLAHLPQMDQVQSMAQEATWRVKNPRRSTRILRVMIPAFAPVLLLLLSFAIYVAWPEADIVTETVGMVVHRDGSVLRSHDGNSARHAVALESNVLKDERYETGADASLMLALAGPTHVKVDRGARVKILSSRALKVETGRVWLDVCKARQKFRVTTPTAEIIVFGTQFSVEVDSEKTTVAVAEGEVTVEQDELFAVLHPGEELVVPAKARAFEVREAPVDKLMAWARHIQPDMQAHQRFEAEVPAAEARLVRADQVYRLDVNGRTVEAITLSWDGGPVGDRAGYDIYVFDDHMEPLVREHISAAVFNDASRTDYELVIMPGAEPITGARALNIKTVPDFSEGTRETAFREIATHIYD